MVHKYFEGKVPDAAADTPAEKALRDSAVRTIAEFAPAFDELNFSEALKSAWTLIAETDGYLTANAPWKKPADRSETDHKQLQARVLSTAAESIRVITALVYPILPESASKVWRQLGQGDIADAAKHAFLTNVAWGGLKPGIQFGEPAQLFPRAEKDAIDRMQNLEDENNKSVVEAASQQENAPKSAPEAPTSALKCEEQHDSSCHCSSRSCQAAGHCARESRSAGVDQQQAIHHAGRCCHRCSIDPERRTRCEAAIRPTAGGGGGGIGARDHHRRLRQGGPACSPNSSGGAGAKSGQAAAAGSRSRLREAADPGWDRTVLRAGEAYRAEDRDRGQPGSTQDERPRVKRNASRRFVAAGRVADSGWVPRRCAARCPAEVTLES